MDLMSDQGAPTPPVPRPGPGPGPGPATFGRVDADGTVYVRTQAGERAVGQVPDVPPEEAMAFFTRRYDALELEVSLLETRIGSGALSPTTRCRRSRPCGRR